MKGGSSQGGDLDTRRAEERNRTRSGDEKVHGSAVHEQSHDSEGEREQADTD